ncbi:MAG: hypothetical protein ACXAC7_16640 [Candidatus Hodarchaeales archaeon]
MWGREVWQKYLVVKSGVKMYGRKGSQFKEITYLWGEFVQQETNDSIKSEKK